MRLLSPLPPCQPILHRFVAPSCSALDSLPEALKLRAVAVSLARRNDARLPDLLAEMAQKSVTLDAATRTSLIDSLLIQPDTLHTLLKLHPPQGYASFSLPRQSTQSSRVSEQLDPTKTQELSIALAFLSYTSTCLGVEVLEPTLFHHAPDEATALLILLTIALAFDRYSNQKAVWQSVQRGLNRLLVRDPVRQTKVDAAYFLVAYTLGLPWYPFRPARAAIQRYFSSDADLQRKCIVWIAAGCAIELQIDGRLVDTDLSTLNAFLTSTSTSTDNYTLQDALHFASAILEAHKDPYRRLFDAMLEGKSAGECVIILEQCML